MRHQRDLREIRARSRAFGTLEKQYSSFERRQVQSDTAMGNKNSFFEKLIGVTTCNKVVALYW